MDIIEINKLIIDDIKMNTEKLYIEENLRVGLYSESNFERMEMIKAVFGIEECRERRVEIFGKDINRKRNAIISKVGFGFKDVLDPKMTVDRVFKIHGSYFKELTSPRIEDVMQRFYFYDFRKKKLSSLSNFMKSKLSIAISVLNNPDILVYDGILDALDSQEREEIKNIIKSESEGRTLLLSSNSLEDVIDITDIIYEIREGKINVIYGD